MSRQAGTLLVAGTAAAAGLTYYNLRGEVNPSPATNPYSYANDHSSSAEDARTPRSSQARSKRDDLGINGAGVGGNAVAGAMEGRGRAPAVHTDAPREKLPAGGVGGGVGAGGASARVADLTMPRERTKYMAEKANSAGSGSDMSKSKSTKSTSSANNSSSGFMDSIHSIQGFFGQGGAKAGHSAARDTRSISQMGSEVESKKRPPQT